MVQVERYTSALSVYPDRIRKLRDSIFLELYFRSFCLSYLIGRPSWSVLLHDHGRSLFYMAITLYTVTANLPGMSSSKTATLLRHYHHLI